MRYQIRHVLLMSLLLTGLLVALPSCNGKSAQKGMEMVEKVVGKSKAKPKNLNGLRYTDDAVRAIQKVTSSDACTYCEGTGVASSYRDCYLCDGAGVTSSGYTCSICGGSGRVNYCYHCGGTGKNE